MVLLLMRNVFRHCGDFYSIGRKCLESQIPRRWWLNCGYNSLKKFKNENIQKVTICSDAGLEDHSFPASLLNTESDYVVKTPDLVKVMAMPFNLVEGGQYIINVLKTTDASVVIIFVRSSVLANELVKQLKENQFNAIEVNESSQHETRPQDESCIFVVSDRICSTVTLPKTDLVIQVQAPLSGINIMKQRLHVANFANPLASTVLLYNSNDSDFISQLGQYTTITTISPPSFHKSQDEDDNLLPDRTNQVILPAVNRNLEKSPAVSRKVKTSLFKPVYPEGRKSKRFGFVDKVRLYVIGGSGGNGSPRTGARGGDGGDVILECHPKATLSHFHYKENRRPKAAHGQHCCIKAKRVNGQRGDDLIVHVPLGTVIKDETTDRVLADMDEVGQRLKVACGGRGGSPSTFEGGGEKGERKMIILEYRMQTDVGLVGFPNAGKSTLLRALSNAKPKVAEYAFTSLKPTLGRVEYEDFSQLMVADLPGLLEGAHMNKGLGLKFLRHVEKAKLLLFVVDINGFQLSHKHPKRTAFETVCLLAKELILHRKNLIRKPKILVINKMDCVGAEKEFLEIRKKIGEVISLDKILPIEDHSNVTSKPSAVFKFEHLHLLEDFKFDRVIAASALQKTGIHEIIATLQELMVRHEDVRYLQQ